MHVDTRTARTVGASSWLRSAGALAEVRWAAASLVLFLLAWGTSVAGAPDVLVGVLFAACYLTGGWSPAWAGIDALRERRLDVDLLMIVAALAAAAVGQVLDGGLLVVIFATSGALEVVVTQRTRDSVASLMDLAPDRATVLLDDGRETLVDRDALVVGQRVLVRPGERVGADGTVVAGVSEVDQQAITGESVPVVRQVGDEVLSGTVNGTGTLTVAVTRAAADTVIARIVRLVEEASATKARTQLTVERVEQAYSLGVVVATLLVVGVPLALLDQPFEEALLRAITFMIVASPCAVVLATMPPLLAAIAHAGRRGVLVKSATAMEGIGRTTVVAFDKTGTLTEGEPEVVGVDPVPGWSADEVLAVAAAVERYSEHPLGRAVVRAAAASAHPRPTATDFRAHPGRGVTGVLDDGRAVSVARADDASASTAGTVVAVEVDGRQAGTITLVDRLRPAAPAGVAEVSAVVGRPSLLLTGDAPGAAASVAAATGITEVHHGLLPDDKVRLVADLEAAGERAMVVGDGVNDAPALAAATVGVAMGRRGSDLALDTADAVIVSDDLSTLAGLVRLARRANRCVVANLALAATVIGVLVAWDLAATLPLPLAVAGHEGSTVLVALNGLRLLRRRAWDR